MDQFLIAQACRDVVIRAAACVDANDAATFARLFTDDGVLVRPAGKPLIGRDAIRQAYEQRSADRITRHLVTNMLVDVNLPDQASVRSYVLLWSGSAGDEDGESGRPAKSRQLVGEFKDHFVRDNEGAWLIRHRQARFVLYREA